MAKNEQIFRIKPKFKKLIKLRSAEIDLNNSELVNEILKSLRAGHTDSAFDMLDDIFDEIEDDELKSIYNDFNKEYYSPPNNFREVDFRSRLKRFVRSKRGQIESLCEDKIFENEIDIKMKPWVQQFNKYDLYTKSNNEFNINELKGYYLKIFFKYFNSEYLVV